MQRIAILSVHTSPIAQIGGKKVGGMNTYVREIARAFAAQGVLVDIYTRRISPQEPHVSDVLGAGVRVITVNAGGAVPLDPMAIYPHVQAFTAGVMAHAMRHHIVYDVVFSHYWLSGLVAQALKEAWGTPFVQMFHTLGHMKNRIPSNSSPAPALRIHGEHQLVASADAVIANTPAGHDQLVQLYNADPRKIWVYPPGVDLERFAPRNPQAARAKLGMTGAQHWALFVGRIEPLKAVDSLIEAFAFASEHWPEVMTNTRLAVIGGIPSDPDVQALAQLADTLGITAQVDFLGAKPNHSLADYYAAADVVVMPSEYESFGMVALEAMASGTPVVASAVGGLVHLVRDGESGYLVPPRTPSALGERLATLLGDTHMRDRMGQHAADLAQNYAWPTVARHLLNEFEDLRLAKRRHRNESR